MLYHADIKREMQPRVLYLIKYGLRVFLIASKRSILCPFRHFVYGFVHIGFVQNLNVLKCP